MDLSFQEKSVWGLLAGILLVSAFYFPRALAIVELSGNPVALVVISVIGVMLLVVAQAIYHAVIAATGRDAIDERDRLIDMRAERTAGFALGLMLFGIIGHIISATVTGGGSGPHALLIAVYIIAALTASEVVKLVTQVWLYRVGS